MSSFGARSLVREQEEIEPSMQEQNQVSRIISLVAITAFAAPAIAAPGFTTSGENKIFFPTTSKTPPTAPANPTWQDYQMAAMKARIKSDVEKSDKYYEAAFLTLTKSLKSNPSQSLSKKDEMIASAMCVHLMYVDGSAILKGPDGSDMTDAKDLEELVEKQQKNFTTMKSAHTLLKKINPGSGDEVAFELKKCSEFMAKTKDKLEKAQAAESKTQ